MPGRTALLILLLLLGIGALAGSLLPSLITNAAAHGQYLYLALVVKSGALASAPGATPTATGMPEANPLLPPFSLHLKPDVDVCR
jgi:hypothetical protein